jgi:hypothetical protein
VLGRLDTVMDVPAAAISANDSFFFVVVVAWNIIYLFIFSLLIMCMKSDGQYLVCSMYYVCIV